MGPFETIDLNAPGGLADYCERYGPLYADDAEADEAARMGRPSWSADWRRRGARSCRRNMHAVRQEWRDRRLMALLAHKAAQPE